MAPLPPDRRRERACIAIASRWHPDDPGLAERRRDYRAASAERYIRELVDTHPPLTPQQRARLAVLLLSAASGDAA
jgi:hypothetical protein